MKIGGIIPTSFIDYPDNISTVIFTDGCNLNCDYCHNHELIKGAEGYKPTIPEEKVLDFLDDRKDNYIDGVVISGGEPCMQGGLVEFIEKIKQRDLKVKLDTNGAYPGVLRKLLRNNLLDYVAMDLKVSKDKMDVIGIKTKKVRDLYLSDIMKSIRYLRKYKTNNDFEYEFRTTVIPGIHNERDIEELTRLIADTTPISYTIQNFRPKGIRDKESLPNNRF